MKVPEVVTIGETMVMFSPESSGPLRYVSNFRKRMAGAESNVAIGLCRLGHSSGWISKVGQDEFGYYLLREIRGEGVDTSNVKIDPNAPTGIMFKEIHEGRETRVYYYRRGSAASLMSPEDLDESYIANSKILHITGITPALSSSCLNTIKRAIDIAKNNDVMISFDPNIRLKLWSKEKAAETIKEILPHVDILLPGVDEGEIILGLSDPHEIIDAFLNYGIKIVALKMGALGAWVGTNNEKVKVDTFSHVKKVDPIGAGDAFVAGFLSGILENKSLFECGRMANAMGSFAITTVGDIEGLPTRAELDAFLNNDKGVFR
ncbi:MAG: 2-dehydro-3-deoxygluconokinase [Epulopiscium sp.]|jgi:2-dehydro-3-deoxygluconokinase|nr:2-dehydro-3-deoxygluconokinase [Candidatus Epulonipiscium sp.]